MPSASAYGIIWQRIVRTRRGHGKESEMIDEERTQHPSFGTIQLNRTTSSPGAALFNSPMRHGRFVTITIARASLGRAYHTDWIHPEEELIEVQLSQHQWAEFVSSFGVGEGVPCTISCVGRERMPEVPDIGLKETFEAEVKAAIAGLVEKVTGFRKEVAALMDKPRLVKADRDRLRSLADAIEIEIGSNIPFLQAKFEEAMGKTVGVAKAEVLAHVASVVRMVGLKNLERAGGLPTLGIVDAETPALPPPAAVRYCQYCIIGLGRKGCPECAALNAEEGEA